MSNSSKTFPKLGILAKVFITTTLVSALLFIFISLLENNGIHPLNLRSFVPDEVLVSPTDLNSLNDVAKIKSLRADSLRNIVWAFGSSLGLFLALIGLINSLHRTQQKDIEIAHQEASQKAARRIADSDLFSNGVSKLGASEPEVQVGGLYELEFLAKADLEYSETDNTLPIAIKNTLASFIRLKSKNKDEYARGAIQTAAIIMSRTFSNIPNYDNSLNDVSSNEELLNLREANFSNCYFPTGMDFSNCDLSNATFESAQLVGASFTSSSLVATKFNEANLSLAHIMQADISNASFHKAKLDQSDFLGAIGLRYSSIAMATKTDFESITGLDFEQLKKSIKPEETSPNKNDMASIEEDSRLIEYKGNLQQFSSNIDEKALKKITKYLGVALLNKDAALVSCSDEYERERIASGFLVKKLSLNKKTALAAIDAVCEEMKDVRLKSRVTFYYLLAKHANKLKDL